MKRTTLVLDPGGEAALAALCERWGTTQTEVVKRALQLTLFGLDGRDDLKVEKIVRLLNGKLKGSDVQLLAAREDLSAERLNELRQSPASAEEAMDTLAAIVRGVLDRCLAGEEAATVARVVASLAN